MNPPPRHTRIAKNDWTVLSILRQRVPRETTSKFAADLTRSSPHFHFASFIIGKEYCPTRKDSFRSSFLRNVLLLLFADSFLNLPRLVFPDQYPWDECGEYFSVPG